MDKVLLASPISDHKDYCLPKWYEHAHSYRYPMDILLVDNSRDTEYYKQYSNCIHVDPTDSIIETITSCQNLIRKYFLRGDWDWLFMNECDIFAPVNIVEWLLHFENYIMTASYPVLSKTSEITLCRQDQDMTRSMEWTKLMSPKEGFHAVTGKVERVFACGIGCTLIHRNIIEQIPFRWAQKTDSVFSDTYFYIDLQKLGYYGYQDTSILVEHQMSNWNAIPELSYRQ